MIWKKLESKLNCINKCATESYKELRDSQFYYNKLVRILLTTVSTVPTSCIPITNYQIVVNIKMKLLRNKL